MASRIQMHNLRTGSQLWSQLITGCRRSRLKTCNFNFNMRMYKHILMSLALCEDETTMHRRPQLGAWNVWTVKILGVSAPFVPVPLLANSISCWAWCAESTRQICCTFLNQSDVEQLTFFTCSLLKSLHEIYQILCGRTMRWYTDRVRMAEKFKKIKNTLLCSYSVARANLA